jgi:uncharacterized protein (DUF952 family)
MNLNRKTKIEVIIEIKDGILWGIVENKGSFVATPFGKNTNQVIENLKELIVDYKKYEGKKDKFWSKVDVNNLEFDIKYELQAFFDEFKELKISSIAEKANLNPSLLRQYSTGNKQLSTEQALHQLGNRLKRISIYA